jgi:asparagine synthase (glutamine-hydrolysing)
LNRTIKKQVPVQLASIRNILTLRYDPQKTTFEKKLQLRDFRPIDYGDSVPQKIEAMLRNEIRIQLGKAKNVAIPIGSGIDSAVIMTLAREEFPEKNIFGISLGFSGSQDETADAKRICRAIGTECHIARVKNVLLDLPLQINIVGEPRWNLWYYYVLEHARKLGADLLLTGDGGDELFGGYVFRYSKYLGLIGSKLRLPSTVSENDVVWARRAWAYLQCHDRDWVPDQERMFGSKMSGIFDWSRILQYFKPNFDSSKIDNDLSQVFLADYNGKLIYDWIPTNAKLSKYFETRMSSPFLTESLIEYAPHIPVQQKYNLETQQGKLVLRSILERYGILNHVGKKKLGFGMDLVNLWDSHGKAIANEYLEDAVICREELIDKDWLSSTLIGLKKNKDLRYINKVLQLLSLEVWYRTFVTRTMSHKTKLE